MEGLSYQEVLAFAQSWGMIYFVLLFAGVCLYAFWPSNKKTFREASRMALRDDETSS